MLDNFILLTYHAISGLRRKEINFVASVSRFLQCFDTVSWAAGRASGNKQLSGEMLSWLSVYGEVQICTCPS